MIRFVFNELGRHDGLIDFKITFIDESGNGIARILVENGYGEPLVEEPLFDCPRLYSKEIYDVRIEWSSLVAHADECRGEGSAGGTDHYSDGISFARILAMPVDPDENPCSRPSTLREEGGTPCWEAGQFVRGIAAEIEDLCAELDRHRQDLDYHQIRRTAYNAGATTALVSALIFVCIACAVPWPWNLILGIIAAILFLTAMVLQTLANYHSQEADRARRNIEEVEARLEEARDRYRSAIEGAVRACCGMLPSGVDIDPPVCE
jgi:hypothetical protein